MNGASERTTTARVGSREEENTLAGKKAKKSMMQTKGGILISGINSSLKIENPTTPTITDGTLNFQQW